MSQNEKFIYFYIFINIYIYLFRNDQNRISRVVRTKREPTGTRENFEPVRNKYENYRSLVSTE